MTMTCATCGQQGDNREWYGDDVTLCKECAGDKGVGWIVHGSSYGPWLDGRPSARQVARRLLHKATAQRVQDEIDKLDLVVFPEGSLARIILTDRRDLELKNFEWLGK